jgi:hypothetical protein
MFLGVKIRAAALRLLGFMSGSKSPLLNDKIKVPNLRSDLQYSRAPQTV